MGTYEKAYIYFDTNSLECRHSGKSLYLSQFIFALFSVAPDKVRNNIKSRLTLFWFQFDIVPAEQ